MESATFGFIASSLLVGAVFGFVLQRGRYCANTGFRDIIFMNDFTLFRAFILALITMIVGANLLHDQGFFKLVPQTFYPFSNIIGGYTFGLGMVLAGGCGSGVWYKSGEGQLGAATAALGFLIGAAATTNGLLRPVYDALRTVHIPIAGRRNATLWQVFGDGAVEKWVVIGVLALIAAIFLLKGKPFSFGKQKGFYWSVSGLLIGLIGIFAFWAAEYWGGFARGLNFTTPTAETMNLIVSGDAQPTFFPSYALGPFKVTWSLFNIIGVPLGAYIAAKIYKEFKLKTPPAKELLTVFLGGLVMGFGGILGGGCSVGQALTGFTTLSIGSIAATIAMILGNWTLVYFMFIKPMKD
ncbi:MAG: YeeE/YedE family protein [Thermodesulfovibrionia bacterium]|nr:YeeE/YedE family protein [Thermodesulfovibrionia bacterium]